MNGKEQSQVRNKPSDKRAPFSDTFIKNLFLVKILPPCGEIGCELKEGVIDKSYEFEDL